MNVYPYTLVPVRLNKFFRETIYDTRVPDKVENKWLASLGYTSSNDRALTTILTEIGFSDETGKPTDLYTEYRDKSKSADIMKQALAAAYEDLYRTFDDAYLQEETTLVNFIKAKKGYSENVASLAAKTLKVLASSAGLMEYSISTVKQRANRASASQRRNDTISGKSALSNGERISNSNQVVT